VGGNPSLVISASDVSNRRIELVTINNSAAPQVVSVQYLGTDAALKGTNGVAVSAFGPLICDDL
jgi:hypothetical protein